MKSIDRIESVFSRMVADNQRRYEVWLASAVAKTNSDLVAPSAVDDFQPRGGGYCDNPGRGY